MISKIDHIKGFLAKSQALFENPDSTFETVDLTLDPEVIGFIRGLAAAWHVSEEVVMNAFFMAIIDDEPQKLEDLVK